RAGESRRRVGSGSRAGGDEFAGGASHGAGAAGNGERGRGGFEVCAGKNLSGRRGKEYGAIDTVRSQERNRTEKPGGCSLGLHEDLCAGDGNGFGSRGASR